jgi:hypothetical protein
MGATDGSVIGITKIVDNGSEFERFNIIVVSEGYQAAELPTFATDVQDFINQLFSQDPFLSYQTAFNIYRLDVTSNESGADDPALCGGTGTFPHTYFDASFCHGGIRRALQVDSNLVVNVVNNFLPQWHQIIVVVNTPIWGGTGGTIAVTSTSGGWENIAIHELGHAAFSLADEYEYWEGCGIDINRDHYAGGEPSAVNVTTNTDRATIKWHSFIDPLTPLPTTTNANCAQCDPQPTPVPAGTVGAFEGAYYYHCGAYRPEFNCMMRNLSNFCAVCQLRIKQVLRPYLPEVFHIDPLRFEFYPWRIKPLDRWILVAYLILNERMQDLVDKYRFKPGKEFYNTVAQYLGAYIVKKTMPPKEIASAILNLADDFLGNRPMTLRAGDYIDIQNFIKANH